MAAAGGDGGGSNRNILYDSINIKRRQINFSRRRRLESK